MNPTSSRLEDRNKSFQRSVDESDIRREREDKQVELRKKKRIENYVKRSRLISELSENIPEEFSRVSEILCNLDSSLSDPNQNPYTKIVNLSKLILHSQDVKVVQAGLEQLRKFVSTENRKSLEVLATTDLIQKFPDYLSSPDPDTKFNTCWIITNLSSVDNPQILQRLSSSNIIPSLGKLAIEDEIREYNTQAIWALSNFAGDSKSYRDQVYTTGVFASTIRKINTNRSLELNNLSLFVWLISNLFKFSPVPDESMVKSFLDILPKFLMMNQEMVLVDTLRCLFYLTIEGARLAEVFSTSMVSRIIHLCVHDSHLIREKALKVVANLSYSDEVYTRYLIDNKLLDYLAMLLDSEKSKIVQDALLIISNVAANKAYSVVVTGMQLFKVVMKKVASHDREIRNEALIAVRVCLQSRESVVGVIEKDLIDDIVAIIRFSDPETIFNALELLETILKLAAKEGLPAALNVFYESGGVEALDRLQSHPNEKIYNKALEIYHEFIEDQNLAMDPVYETNN